MDKKQLRNTLMLNACAFNWFKSVFEKSEGI